MAEVSDKADRRQRVAACQHFQAPLQGRFDGLRRGRHDALQPQSLLEKSARLIEIAASLGCSARCRGIETSFSHRPGEENRLLALARWAGVWGHLAPDKRIPAPFFAADVSADVVANLLFGIWESDGYVSYEQTGAIRCGFTTTSEQLAHQIHWLLLRFGISSRIRRSASPL